MLHINDKIIKNYVFHGSFGLEKESLRVTENGHPAHTADPITDNIKITRDFCENQMEINTDAYENAEDALQEINLLERQIHQVLFSQPQREYLWPFSNPPFINDNREIPIAQFWNTEADKTDYRLYLSNRYGKYMMTYCGIHVNFLTKPLILRGFILPAYNLTGFERLEYFANNLAKALVP